ncbi:thymidylate synthase [Anaeropeptidivorans aminofermentans]|jgi:thymidylate synthase|uniref:thymidylate synthase n=1 Tax=Anaeropeptidivorans aminofermentans TaxID=2934315 RepID=UPI0020244ACE|nr:thymidylate synthase [Anaeropeptidivorans aminofermentans]MBE6011466.1 thymidylate synthase [Lachnospiraceae bacterium]
MSLYDQKYLDIAENIIENGYFDNNRTNVKTYKLPHQIMQFDLRKEFPVLTTKRMPFITAVKEMLWIFRDQSNDVSLLHKEKVKIWDEWVLEDGTIGTSYGYIVKKFHQIDKLIEDLKNNPQSRRMLISLWQNEYLDTGALYPCCFLTMWDVTDGYLNCMLIQRSGDWGLGIPFNTTQYAVLTLMLSQVTNLKPGLFTHVINNAHLYENQVEALKLQIARRDEAYPAPEVWINPEIKNFYDFTYKDVKLIDYKHHDDIKMEVSV